MFGQFACVQIHPVCPVCGDEPFTVKFDMVGIDPFYLCLSENIEEVFVRTTYDICIFQIFEDGGSEVYRFMGVRFPEVRIIINDRFPFFRIFQKFNHPFSQSRIQGVIGAENKDIVLIDDR